MKKIDQNDRVEFRDFFGFFYYILQMGRVSQITLLTSQTDKYLWDQTFSHYFGQKNCRNAKKKKNLFQILRPN